MNVKKKNLENSPIGFGANVIRTWLVLGRDKII